MDSNDGGSTIFEKTFQKFPKRKTLTCHVQMTIHIVSNCIYKCSRSIYIVLGIVSSLEVTSRLQANVPRLYANTTLFYIRHLLSVGLLEPVPADSVGQQCISFFSSP